MTSLDVFIQNFREAAIAKRICGLAAVDEFLTYLTDQKFRSETPNGFPLHWLCNPDRRRLPRPSPFNAYGYKSAVYEETVMEASGFPNAGWRQCVECGVFEPFQNKTNLCCWMYSCFETRCKEFRYKDQSIEVYKIRKMLVNRQCLQDRPS